MLNRIDTGLPWLADQLHKWVAPHARAISAARDGEPTVIAGEVIADAEPLLSPAWRLPCVWFHTYIKDRPDITPRFDLGGIKFRVRDATGDALVLGMAASVVRAPLANGDGAARASARLAGCLHLGLAGRQQKTPDIAEKIIRPGDYVTVIGYGAWQIDPGGAGKMATLRGETPSVFSFQSNAARHSPTVICHGPASARRILPPGW
jgi:hypothetical protein